MELYSSCLKVIQTNKANWAFSCKFPSYAQKLSRRAKTFRRAMLARSRSFWASAYPQPHSIVPTCILTCYKRMFLLATKGYSDLLQNDILTCFKMIFSLARKWCSDLLQNYILTCYKMLFWIATKCYSDLLQNDILTCYKMICIHLKLCGLGLTLDRSLELWPCLNFK